MKNDDARTVYLDDELTEILNLQWKSRKKSKTILPFVFLNRNSSDQMKAMIANLVSIIEGSNNGGNATKTSFHQKSDIVAQKDYKMPAKEKELVVNKTKKVKPTIRGYLKIFGGTSNTNHITISKANLHFFKNQYVVELFLYHRFEICCVIHDISVIIEKLILEYITRFLDQKRSCRYHNISDSLLVCPTRKSCISKHNLKHWYRSHRYIEVYGWDIFNISHHCRGKFVTYSGPEKPVVLVNRNTAEVSFMQSFTWHFYTQKDV